MKSLQFDWDTHKELANILKHGITFEEASDVFHDDHAIEFYDETHSDWEDRFLLLGISSKQRLLLICHCYREDNAIIRIISARKATKDEAGYYKR